ncbi:element excision factor XisI family protein [Nostoc sp. FACHB-110]|uniref:element excision factor XisI family protein n=1 Tax=Nostoc sp. FACHB-110 TaxID=2692834 RepID=UPI001F5525F6|nr:element excision factor XisI family protein [Nostoc sp. FACHB-110]
MHLVPANRIRGYTNEVRLRGLTQYQGFGTRAGVFCLCSRDFSRLVQDMCLGIPKQDIVLGFYPPFMREMSDYAVG